MNNLLKRNRNSSHQLLSYQLKFIIIRTLIVSLTGIITIPIIMFIMGNFSINDFSLFSLFNKLKPRYYLLVTFIYNILVELQILLDNLLERFFPVPQYMRMRFSIQFFMGFILLLTSLLLIIKYSDPQIDNVTNRPYMYIGIFMGMFFVSILVNVLTSMRLTDKWMLSVRQLDMMKQEKLQMDYNSLQDNLNPHFLFNNLSVLKGLMYTNIDAASNFIEDFADVYRYVLQSNNKQLVKLSEELEFMDAYLDLHKTRIKGGLQIEINIMENTFNMRIAPLALQLLVENAIKHNIATTESPLIISITSTENFINVKNTINQKENTYSTKMGLKNLIKRYEFLSEKEVQISDDGKNFEVKVPLI